MGRRTDDDSRQIDRWGKCTGNSGRWRNNLIGTLSRGGKPYDDHTTGSKIRQILLHWAYELTEKDANEYIRTKKKLKKLPKSQGEIRVPKNSKAKLLNPYNM